ncbi:MULTISPECIES: DUF6624 domain-containing protein [unclassified Chryseobacterium]|uniref:DUF6624 domain-containing protein n=1 Tax=unclassified Chryseobacterium TaxID=2593645 RepID=UPI000D8D3781|nr:MULTISPECIES: DUF6624 domain-containing protein [unclassified Chryseobacterium]PWW27582.1 hypothetical protein DEU40_10682 [Chryseobacterium sp. AG844]
MRIRLYHILLTVMVCCFSCKKKEDYSEVQKTLEKALTEDQKYREPDYDYIKQNPIDEKNIEIVTKIIDSLGWLGKDKIGENANTALFAVIMHANKLETMEKYLPILKEAAKKGNAEKSQVAYLTDRIELLNNRKQIYGTQPSIRSNGKTFIENLIDSANVNARRKSMGLDPIENYIRICDSANSVMNK